MTDSEAEEGASQGRDRSMPWCPECGKGFLGVDACPYCGGALLR